MLKQENTDNLIGLWKLLDEDTQILQDADAKKNTLVNLLDTPKEYNINDYKFQRRLYSILGNMKTEDLLTEFDIINITMPSKDKNDWYMLRLFYLTKKKALSSRICYDFNLGVWNRMYGIYNTLKTLSVMENVAQNSAYKYETNIIQLLVSFGWMSAESKAIYENLRSILKREKPWDNILTIKKIEKRCKNMFLELKLEDLELLEKVWIDALKDTRLTNELLIIGKDNRGCSVRRLIECALESMNLIV